nr:MAG TPA: helix-turn-helix domain protein [Caudoviricetes sp.]DAQ78405.1 MAG TPA: helix-turn-helix domain protein [Caudoviricetes sp.]
MYLGENIRYLRTKNGYSQDYIADKLGYKSFTTIQKWESGISEPPVKKLKELSVLFGVDMDELNSKNLALETNNTSLNTKDRKEISEILANTEELLRQDGLMFDGEPASRESIESILSAMKIGMEMAKQNNKKYTPNKYKKD